jgi:hypothetical protein
MHLREFNGNIFALNGMYTEKKSLYNKYKKREKTKIEVNQKKFTRKGIPV